MPQHNHASGHVCRHCDGFPVVHITTGEHNSDGTRRTLAVVCPACNGNGTAPVRRVPVTVGR